MRFFEVNLPLYLSLFLSLHSQHNADLKAAASCAPHELELPIALRLGRDISAQLTAVQGQLNLCAKSVDDKGAIALAAALNGNATVNELHLGSNRIGDAGAVSLAAVLASSSGTWSDAGGF